MKTNHWYKEQGLVPPTAMNVIMGDVMSKLFKINIRRKKIEVK